LEDIMSWTKERVDLLKKLWAEGASASAIAARLGEVTRNAVIGKVHRLKSPPRATGRRYSPPKRPSLPKRNSNGSTLRSSSLPAKSVSTRRHNLSLDLTELGPAPDLPVTVQTLTANTCRWPEGDPKLAGFHFCGRTKPHAAEPYCVVHAAIAYR
jgi:GcrA cell cycle regulator